MQLKPFTTVRPNVPGRSVFDLSYSTLFTADMGKIYPVACEEAIPFDRFKLGGECVVRMLPLVAPVLHQVDVHVHAFFIPNRLLWNEQLGDDGSFEDFISGGDDGTVAPSIPYWDTAGATQTAVGTLWDYFGLGSIGTGVDNVYPVDLPRRAYYLIWNEYYRDQWLQPKLDIEDQTNYEILLRNYAKDYFSSALLSPQKGTAPALPLTGTAPVEFDDGTRQAELISYVTPPAVTINVAQDNIGTDSGTPALVDFSNIVTVDAADMRLLMQVQRWLERNARGGTRYIETIMNHFGPQAAPTDERLQRPEYIGGFKSPLIISEVLQTSETDTTPQGTLAGHGISVGQEFIGDYNVKEYGYIMILLSIMPKPMYNPQGINRQWLKFSRYDYYWPEFANLTEQEIYNCELYYTYPDSGSDNLKTFGYQGRYDHYRYRPNIVCGEMRTTFDYWHLARSFGALPDLNSDFIECDPDKRIFASESDPGFMVHYGNLINALRPLPIIAEPGYMDH